MTVLNQGQYLRFGWGVLTVSGDHDQQGQVLQNHIPRLS
jgi:hypothetical protein